MVRVPCTVALALALMLGLDAEARSSRHRPCKVIGLTGGVASGKSTISRMFERRGAKIVDADRIARRIVEPGQPALRAITRTFGRQMLRPDGTLDRKRLGALVFSDPAQLKQLNRITHPRIAAEARRQIAGHRRAGAPLVVYDAALIVENGWNKSLDGLVVVGVPERVQLQRLMQRDGLSRELALQRIRAQLPLADKVRVADHVIDNSGTLRATERQVDRLFKTLVR